jgi:hypothetical protein
MGRQLLSRPAWFLALTGLVLLAACSAGGGETGNTGGTTTATGGAGGAGAAGTTSTPSAGSGGTGSGVPQPDPACLVPAVDAPEIALTLAPSAPTSKDALVASVTDADTAHTNVGVRLCTPEGLQTATFGGVDSGNPPYAWHWTSGPLPAGVTQVAFFADPAETVYETALVTVAEAAPDMDAGSDAPVEDLCAPSAGDLLGHGTFEEGMDGLAPAFWQVRSPDMPYGTCLSSGPPESHVFLIDAPAGCGGKAIAVDAKGQWDCYAVQRFSDYDTIVGGATYRIRAAIRSQGNAPMGDICPECSAAWFHVGAQWLDGNDAVFGDEKNPKPPTPDLNDHDWQVVSWDVVAPASAKRIVVWLSAHYPGRVDIDNVTVSLVGG